jgi:hypothetical protein
MAVRFFYVAVKASVFHFGEKSTKGGDPDENTDQLGGE